jgi:phosphatidylethanolamine/phosphatidyl-N-methylethanolamine N-methyltransferase
MERATTLVREHTQRLAELTSGISWLASPVLFWRQSLKQPIQICSLFPSRPSVGRHLFEAVSRHKGQPIVELGAGTGAVTRQLLRGGIEARDLTVVELDPEFTAYLSRHFPGVDVLNMKAEDVAEYWQNRGADQVGAVVSTLPMKLFDAELQQDIIGSMMNVMADGAPFVQLTYRLSSPVKPEVLENLGLRGRRVKTVWRSIPPAFLWKYERR